MNADSLNPLSIEQVEVDLFLANAAIQKAEELSSGKGKYYRGQAGYHLQQAAEKLIKLQIYDSNAEINNAKMYRHSLDDLITYAASLGVTINIPKWINEKKYVITSWEAMKIRIGDIFESNASTLVNTVNCVGVMGKGIALEFKKRFPRMYRDYTERCESGNLKPGEPYLYMGEESVSILNFPTKDNWRSPSKMSYIIKGLDWFVDNYENLGIESIAFPPLGCGNGGLTWELVGPLMYSKLEKLPINIEIYAPFGTPEEQLSDEYLREHALISEADVLGHKGIRINKYWFLILYVIKKLNEKKYSLNVGRTIFQKTCYILTRCGIPTGFRFEEGSYGPYSEDVKKAITALSNGNYMTERKLGNMLVTVVNKSFKLDEKQFTAEEIATADQTVDLMSRIKSTSQAEMIGTVLFAYDELSSQKENPTEFAILERIHEWKHWWKESRDKEIINTIEDLSVSGWIHPDRNNDVLVMDYDLV